jgi:UDP-N-acetylmuramoylalanine--D-glutamate ligase
MDLRKKKVVVAGLGVSGLWTARWLAGQGAVFTVSDQRGRSQIGLEVCDEVERLGGLLETGGHGRSVFLDSDMIVLSPGVPQDMELFILAREKGIPVVGEMELAFRVVSRETKSRRGVPIIAVTGTNGKSTVTEFIGFILKMAQADVFVGGNIGTPLIALACQERMPDFAVVEVSSFQLDTIEEFSPYISLCLNVSPDHLERYTSYNAYIQSKLRIFENQHEGQFAIINDDDEVLSGFRSQGGVRELRYGMVLESRGPKNEKVKRDAFIRGEDCIAELGRGKRHEFSLAGFRLPGAHNRSNLLAVVLATLCAGVDPEIIRKGIREFSGLHHRIEFVGEIKGIRYYDDSKATNLDAAIKAVECFDSKIVLIAGGRHKGADYKPLVDACLGKVKKAVFIGEASELLAEAFEGSIPYSMAGSMEDAVSIASKAAAPGEVVLLAPACSSFDMFTDYAHRGRIFSEAARSLTDV